MSENDSADGVGVSAVAEAVAEAHLMAECAVKEQVLKVPAVLELVVAEVAGQGFAA